MDQFDIELAQASEQRSETWRDVRAGRFTASELWKLMSDPRSNKDKDAGKFSDGALTYIYTKVAEHITGLIHQESPAYPLVWGEEQEPFAKIWYQDKTGNEIKRAGFVAFTDHSGGSPDGYIGDDTVVEIKCPYNSANQIEYLNLKDEKELKENFIKHWVQLQSNMMFSKRPRGLFIAFDPRFDDPLRGKIIEVNTDVFIQTEIAARLEKAINEKLRIVKLLS